MLGALWNRLVGRRNADAVEREVEMQRLSPAERRFAEENVENRRSDSTAEEHLGGIDPERLLGGSSPPRG